jgi:hypothetical protein
VQARTSTLLKSSKAYLTKLLNEEILLGPLLLSSYYSYNLAPLMYTNKHKLEDMRLLVLLQKNKIVTYTQCLTALLDGIIIDSENSQ